jgi:hypothetical protein
MLTARTKVSSSGTRDSIAPALSAAVRCVVAVIGVGLGACALEVREGDGLSTDGREIQIQPTLASDGGSVGGGDGGTSPGEPGNEGQPLCKNLELFKRVALPQIVKHCTSCHDGTKAKAVIVYPVYSSFSPEDQCSATLLTYEKERPKPKSEAALFAKSDPSRPDIDHEFKFEDDPAAFPVFRDAVMMWFMTED